MRWARRLARLPASTPLPHHVVFRQRLGHLLQEKGIALRPGQDHLRQGFRDRLGWEEGLEHLAAVLGREGGKDHLGHIGFLHPGRAIPGAVRGQDQAPRPGQTLDQRSQEGFRGGIDPVQVFHGEDERVPLRAVEHELAQGGKGPGSTHLRTEAGQPVQTRVDPQERKERRLPLIRVQPGGLETQADVRGHRRGAVAREDTTAGPQEVEHRQIGHGLPIRQAVALQIPDRLGWRGRGHPGPELVVELIEQAGLAHPGLPHYPHYMPMALGGLSQEIVEEGDFPRASHEPAQRPLALQRQWRALRLKTDHGSRLPWRRAPLHLEPALDEACHRRRHQNRAWFRLPEQAHRLRQRLRDGEHPGGGVTGRAIHQYLAPVHRLAHGWLRRPLPGVRPLSRHVADG